ncbi:MAG: helix-turn-helix transcriptional regulator [Bacteroidetes bacterium]|nr:helix-turn-helix transcriptional regulator [Bacteroidota bacterium]
MDIKTQLVEILKKENYTFPQLAEYLNMSESALTDALNNKTLELRNLELISKALRVPLYSFFRSEDVTINYSEKPYYINKLWTGDDSVKDAGQLNDEIGLLKEIITLKEDQIRKIQH